MKIFICNVKAAAFKYGEVEGTYDIISPLRVLLAKKKQDSEIFFDMESHSEDRKSEGGDWADSHEFITKYFKDRLGFKDSQKASKSALF